MITIWFGAVGDIPAGWVLCDGTLGTPDLRNKFVVGAGDTFAPGDIGGSATHDHDFTGDGHIHQLQAGADFLAGAGVSSVLLGASAVGTTDTESNIPPYMALCFIMKT